jgi:hypothetical protein
LGVGEGGHEGAWSLGAEMGGGEGVWRGRWQWRWRRWRWRVGWRFGADAALGRQGDQWADMVVLGDYVQSGRVEGVGGSSSVVVGVVGVEVVGRGSEAHERAI